MKAIARSKDFPFLHFFLLPGLKNETIQKKQRKKTHSIFYWCLHTPFKSSYTRLSCAAHYTFKKYIFVVEKKHLRMSESRLFSPLLPC